MTEVKYLTPKEAFEKVYDTFITKELPRCSPGGGCYYWLPDKPHGCGIGCLMTLEARKALHNSDQRGVYANSSPEVIFKTRQKTK